MKLPIDIKNISILKKHKFSLSLFLWIFLGFVALMVGSIMYGEIRKITTLRTDEDAAKSQITRVNQDLFKKLEQKLNENASFVPREIPNTDIFMAAPQSDDRSR